MCTRLKAHPGLKESFVDFAFAMENALLKL